MNNIEIFMYLEKLFLGHQMQTAVYIDILEDDRFHERETASFPKLRTATWSFFRYMRMRNSEMEIEPWICKLLRRRI